MTKIMLPATWLIVLIVGLPQLSETVYSPALPEIARFMHTSEVMVEHTLTIYLFSFALGTLFWGKLSDHCGRKPCIIAGLMIFLAGSIACYLSTNIEALMFSRFVQAFGGSIGSVLGQAICRDAFQGPQLGKIYAVAGSALALFPAIGPAAGGLISQYSGWQSIFLFLTCFAIALSVLVSIKLPETHAPENRNKTATLSVAQRLITDKKVLGLGFIVAACNGISFSYFSEGSFFLINGLGLSPSKYGISFVCIALATMLGGICSKKLQDSCATQTIMVYGLKIIAICSTGFALLSALNHFIAPIADIYMIAITIISQMSIMFGVCMATSNALALALADYRSCIGTASSLFGCFYYGLISLFTLGMGLLHNGTLLPMPFYFMGLALLMLMAKSPVLSRC